jgi:hypothetical protein
VEAIAEAILASGLAERDWIDQIVDELYRLGRDNVTIMSAPRIVQVWGRKSDPAQLGR